VLEEKSKEVVVEGLENSLEFDVEYAVVGDGVIVTSVNYLTHNLEDVLEEVLPELCMSRDTLIQTIERQLEEEEV